MTREELEKVIQHFKSLRIIQRESFMREGFDVAIKALEQESVIDKIRAEIMSLTNGGTPERIWNVDVLEIIDKYKAESEGKEKLSWLGKNCKDCGNGKCKKLGTLPKGYDCALWQPKVENYSIKTVTNAKEAENYPISEDISKAFEEFSKTMSIQRQAESEEVNEQEK